MRIVELNDYSMVIMKDSQDPSWVNVGDVYRRAFERNVPRRIMVCALSPLGDSMSIGRMTTNECLYSAGRLILLFKDKIKDAFKLHSKVSLEVVV